MPIAREPKRRRPVPAASQQTSASATPARRQPVAASAAGGNALGALEAQLASAPKGSLPYLVELQTLFGCDLSGIANALGVRDSLLAVGARAAATADTVAFADASPPLGLVAHEVAHVLQHEHGDASEADAEAEAHHARTHAELDMEGPFDVRGGAGASIQLDTGTDEPAPKPTRAARIESPFAAVIGAEVKTAVPGRTNRALTLSSPVEGKVETTTLPIEQQVLNSWLVTAYAVPLEDTFATPQAAREERTKREQIFAAGAAALGIKPVATPAPPTPPAKTATTPPAPHAPPVIAPAPVPNVGSPPSGEVVYDLAETPIKLVARAEGWGVTMEFTKLAVGAASCGVLQTESGFVMLDAGVRHTGDNIDLKLIEHAVTQSKAILLMKSGTHAPVENLMFSHSHLDHVGIFERLSRELVIKKITVNTVQLRDPKFQEALLKFATNQLEVHKRQITERLRESKRAEWDKSSDSQLEQEAAAKERAFEKYLSEQADIVLKQTKIEPLKLVVDVPAGTGTSTIKVELPGIEIVPRDAKLQDGSYVAQDPLGRTVLDLAFGKQALEGPAETPTALRDQLESNYFLKLENGNLLAIIPDMRGGDIATNGKAVVEAVKALGGNITLLEIGHHFQAGFLEAGKSVGFDKASGLVMSSELAHLGETLTKMVRAAKGTYAITSGEVAKFDPMVFKFLDLCGVVAVPVTAHDVKFVSAVTAKGERIEGFTSGEAVKSEHAGVLVRVDATLDKLNDQLADARVGETTEAADLKRDGALDLLKLEAAHKSLEGQLDALDKAIKRKDYQGKTSAERRNEAKRMREEVRALERKIGNHPNDVAKKIQEGPARVAAQRIRDTINELMRAKEATLRLFQDARDSKKPLDEKKLAEEVKRLETLVDAEFAKLGREAGLPRITETSLILLGKNVQRTVANAELIDAWRATYEARVAAEAATATLEAQIEYAKQLQRLRDVIAKQPHTEIADQKAVQHELEFIDKQIEASAKVLLEQAETLGKKTTGVDPLTGSKVETTVLSEQTALEAAEKAKPGEPEPQEAAPKQATKEAGPAAPKAEGPTFYQRFDKSTRWLGDKAGRGMGAMMVFQNIKASVELADAFANGTASLPATGLGFAKNAYGIQIGYRMLKGVHVNPLEFVLVSALDVAQALLGDYTSTAEYNTEVTYALISGGLNTALMYIGGALMTLGPFGMIAGFIVMALGETILNALGVKAWLSKMFDPRPNEMIDLDVDLQKEIEAYAFTIGAAELKAEQDPMLVAYGASDPAAVRTALDKELRSRRGDLIRRERTLVDLFDGAYKRAKKGYMGLKWLDDQRARFTSLFLKVHDKNDDIAEAGQLASFKAPTWPWQSYEVKYILSKRGVLERLQATEAMVSFADATEDDVRGMEQWTKLDKRIDEVVELLYHEDYNYDNFEYIDWMKVNEAVSLIEQMISNARYRLDPTAQGNHRVAPLLPDGPAKKTYEQLVLQYENKVDVLRQRVLGMSLGTGERSGIKVEGEGLYWGKDVIGLPAVYFDKGTYYEPEYGNVSAPPTEKAVLDRLDQVINMYMNFMWERSEEVGLPEGVTLTTLQSDIDAIRAYRKAMTSKEPYKNHMFNLQSTRAATLGTLERAHRLFDASPTAQPRLDKADTAFKEADGERISEYGHYLLEELPELEQKVGMAHASAVAAVFGDTKEAPQMTAMEHVAAADEDLASLKLSTIRDRVIKANVVMPTDPDTPIRRMFCIVDNHDVIVAIAPDTEIDIRMHYTGVWAPYYTVIPLNLAAVKYVGEKETSSIPLYRLVPVTLNNLKNKTPITAAPLRQDPPTRGRVIYRR